MLRASLTLQPCKNTRQAADVSTNRKSWNCRTGVCRWPGDRVCPALGPCAGRLADFAAKVGRENFDRATHFIEPGTHSYPDAVCKGIFLHHYALAVRESRGGLRRRFFVQVICGEQRHPPFVVTRVQD